MPQQLTFDKADLVRFFYEAGIHAQVGKFTVIIPKKDLFGDHERKLCPIEALTTALWCEKYGFAVVIQQIDFPEGGKNYLATDHPLRQERRINMRYGDGGSSAELVRWVTALADTWRTEIEEYVPAHPIDLRPVGDIATVSLSYNGNSVELGTGRSEPEGTPVDDDHRPAGIGADDLFGNDKEGQGRDE